MNIQIINQIDKDCVELAPYYDVDYDTLSTYIYSCIMRILRNLSSSPNILNMRYRLDEYGNLKYAIDEGTLSNSKVFKITLTIAKVDIEKLKEDDSPIWLGYL